MFAFKKCLIYLTLNFFPVVCIFLEHYRFGSDIVVKDDGSVLRNPLKTGLGKVNRVLVGNRMWMLNHGVKISGSQDKALETRELEGETAVVCAINGIALAVHKVHRNLIAMLPKVQ